MVTLGYFYLILTAAEQGVVKGSSDLANPAAGLQFISVSVYYAGGEGPAAGFGAGADDGVEVEFLAHVHLVTIEQSTGFLNTWNESRNYREKIYISYDSTNKNCQAGDIKMVEFGHPKVDMGEPVFNYAVAYDTHNQEPLFYEKYPGSLNDISQLQFMLDKASGCIQKNQQERRYLLDLYP